MSRDNVVAVGILLCYAAMIAAARWAVLRADRGRSRPRLRLIPTAPSNPPALAERTRAAPRSGAERTP